MGLLHEIQNDIAMTGEDVTSALRKCKILAARLGSDEFTRWVDWELNGYPELQPTPEYRRLAVGLYGSFMNLAWRVPKQPVPLQIVPEKYRNSFQQVEFRKGIAKIASFIADGARIDRPELVFLLQGKMFPGMNCIGVWMEIPGSEFEQLASAVKNRVLDFVLKIEAEYPGAGEAPLNSQPVPKEELQLLVNNFYAPVGNVAQNAQDVNQTADIGIQLQDLVRLVKEFTEHLDELDLDGRQKQKAEAQIATLKAQLTDEPDPIIVMQAGRTLRNITEGAIGSLVATAAQPAVWHWIQQMMAKLFN